jgi:flavin reductase ActVB
MDRASFFAIMGAFPTGVTIVATLDGEQQPRGLTTTALCSVSAEPPLMLLCVDKQSHTLPALRQTKKFVVNYLCAGRGELANLFASKDPDKFAHVAWRPARNGMPWLHTDSIAYAECTITQEVEAGDHFVLIAQVEAGAPPAPGTKPLMYFRRSYGTWHDGHN